MKITVRIEETLVRHVVVNVNKEDITEACATACEIAYDLYRKGNIVLDADDYLDHSIEAQGVAGDFDIEYYEEVKKEKQL